MKELLEEISQISICLKEENERINEIALFQPLARHTEFDETSKPILQRKWSYTYQLPLLRRLSLNVQSFLFKKAPILIPAQRLTKEAKFKTVLALLLAQEPLREFFFSNEKRSKNFFESIKKAAQSIGYQNFTIPSGNVPLKISQSLTLISGKEVSLIDDLNELGLQMAALSHQERNEILFQILNQIERSPITSILEVMQANQIEKITLTTKYAKYKVTGIDQTNGKIEYHYTQDYATSSIRTLDNSLPGVTGVVNQRCAIDSQTEEWIGSYSGELSSKSHLLEQLLFILNLRNEEIFLLNEAPHWEEKTILLTSLLSWHEVASITDQHEAIRNLNQKILKIGSNHYIRLNLIHFNISFNAFNKYPSPLEVGAVIKDINDEALISFSWDLWKNLDLPSEDLYRLKQSLNTIAHEPDFLKYQKQLIEIIDSFREIKKKLISQLQVAPENLYTLVGLALLKGKKENGKKLQGMDLLLYLNIQAKYLNYFHSKNCQNSTDRSAGANAADKAQHAYQKIHHTHFLPGHANEKEISLFKVLYSMYLVWEEPEITAALSTGFLGEKFYYNFFQKNPETTRYLIEWLKKHPETYLGLSDQRS